MSEIQKLISKTIEADPELRKFYENERDRLEVANLIFNLRNREGLSQRDFAEKNNISLENLKRIEEGNIVNL